MKMSSKRILVPVNGTPASEHAFRWACSLARQTRAELYAIHVSEVPMEFPLNTEFVQEDNKGEAILARIEAIAAEEKCKVDAQLLQARHAGPAITLEAEDRQMEMIILGLPYRHRLGPCACALGTTSTYLLEHAPCQVIFWRERISTPALARA
jgi:nucleotide-binding universal stress UspA family protein